MSDYEYIIYQIKENIILTSKYQENMKKSTDSIVKKYYENAIKSLKQINQELEKKLSERESNPNNKRK